MGMLPFDTLKIHHYEVDVEALDSEYARGADLHGEYCSKNLSIGYDVTRDERYLPDTLLHEAIHAICDLYHIDVTKIDDEEDLVRPMATAILQVLKDNPKFSEWLIDG